MTKARDLANIISGGFTSDDIPNLDAAKITSGSFVDARIPNLAASKITSGTFADARIAASNVTQHASSYIDWQSVQTTNFTAVAGKGYPINTMGGVVTMTLPSSASVGDTIKIVDYKRTFATNSLTINTSLNFQGRTTQPVYNTNGQAVTFTYIDSTQGFIPTTDDDVTYETQPSPYSVDFLVIAGGGGGGAQSSYGGGGGGAGGYRASYNNETSGGGGSSESALTFSPGTVYTITVGNGGAGGANNYNGTAGQDSSIAGSDITNVVSAGYGFGASQSNTGGSGGSGGGGAYNASGGSGTSNQGYNGGTGVTSGNDPKGGGGGAGSAGANGSGDNGGAGGSGVASTITGSSVTRASGGGGRYWFWWCSRWC